MVSHSKLNDAVASFRKALNLRPSSPEAHMNLAHALAQQGKLEDAATSYRKALAFRPNDLEVLISLGDVLGRMGKPNEAIVCYRKAIASRPDFPEAHYNLGATLSSLGRLDEAIASYLLALEFNPNFVMALNNLALALMAQGKPTAAFNFVKRSLQVEESDGAKSILVACLSRAPGLPDDKPYTADGLDTLFLRIKAKLAAAGTIRKGLTFHGLRTSLGSGRGRPQRARNRRGARPREPGAEPALYG